MNLYESTAEQRAELGIDTLPENLLDATRELERDDVLRKALGTTPRRRLRRLLRRVQAARGPGRPRADHAVGARPLPPALLGDRCAGSSDCSRSRPTSRSGSARTSARCSAQMADRGPDSAGHRALPRAGAARARRSTALFSPDPDEDWAALGDAEVHASHAVVVLDDARGASAAARARPHLQVVSAGRRIEMFKEASDPREFVARFGLDGDGRLARARPHADGDRESKVTTAGAHPFSTGLDLCLVHNGSLSNHNRLRQRLRREGIAFQTENDTEVAAGFLTWRLREGDTLQAALERCLDDLDGFYTFAVGTADGFAVLRDPIACKPAVMAETDDWVAMASEYRAIAVLPGRRGGAGVGARARARLLVGARAGRMTVAEADRDGRPRRRRRCASSTARLHAADVAPRWRVRQPGRRARRRGRDRRRRRGRRRRPRRLLLRRHEQARDRARARQRGRRAGREHHVRPRRGRRLRRASRARRPAAAGSSSCAATRRRAAGSR